MKRRLKILSVFLSIFLVTGFFAGCDSAADLPDADMLFREAMTNANALTSCDAAYQSALEITFEGEKISFTSENTITYAAAPFMLKSFQTSDLAGASGQAETYTAAEADGIWVYANSGDGWTRTLAGELDTTPMTQIDILRLIPQVASQKMIRSEDISGQKAYKLELTLKSEVLRSAIENIVTSTGIGEGSATIVDTLLATAPELYGYAYISAEDGQFLQFDVDGAEALNTILSHIDGMDASIKVNKYVLSGSLSSLNQAEAPVLPDEAKNGETISAVG